MIKIIRIREPREQANELRERSWNKDLSIPTKNVLKIIDDIQRNGDEGLLKCIEKYENVKIDSFVVSKSEIKEAYENVSAKQIRIIKYMKSKLEKSEKAVIDNLKNIKIDSDGIKINKTIMPIFRVGCYIPGGKARYPSTDSNVCHTSKSCRGKANRGYYTTHEKWKSGPFDSCCR